MLEHPFAVKCRNWAPLPDLRVKKPTEEALKSNHFDNIHNLPRNNETAAWVKFWRSYFHFSSSEYGQFGDLHRINWEYENLISMIVMRDPLERFLSGGKCGGFQTRIPNDPTEDTQDVYILGVCEFRLC